MITAIASLKGGAGKSTLAFNLGIWLAYRGHRVRVYDLDLQKTLTDVLRVRSEEGYKPDLPVVTTHELDIGQLAAEGIEQDILLDIGSSNVDTIGLAVAQADCLIIPVQPSQPDVWATQRFLHLLERQGSLQPAKPVFAFINRADTDPAIPETMEAEAALRQLPGLELLPHRLSDRTAFRRSMSEGLAVFELWASGEAAREFNELATALLRGPMSAAMENHG